MQPESNHVYTIKDEFFEKYPDPNLKQNKQGNRPHYFAFKSERDDEIIWMVPMSSQTKKFENFISKREAQGKPVDMAHVCEVGGKKSAFAIGDMFPITTDLLSQKYTKRGQHLKVVSTDDIQVLNDKVQRIHMLIQKGIRFTPKQVDAKGIEQKLLKELSENKQRNTSKTSAEKSEVLEKESSSKDLRRRQQLARMRNMER